jgi:hypothetical protein
LTSGESYTISRTYSLPRGITGAYYLFVMTDVPNRTGPRGQVIEFSESNNLAASAQPMLIELPPPSDLQVQDIAIPSVA